MQEEYEDTQEDDMDLDKKAVKLGEINELADEDLILSIKTSYALGKAVFGLMMNEKVMSSPMKGEK